jgi:drug/metabolite transporter (DMT)-like permease
VSAPAIDPIAHRSKGKNLVMLISIILLSVLLAAAAQLSLKHGMNLVTDRSGTATISGRSLREIAATPAIWGGLFLFGLSASAWLLVLSRTSLSFAYPFASLTYVLILLADRFVLHQQIPPLRWAGVFCIMLGIVLVAQTPHR